MQFNKNSRKRNVFLSSSAGVLNQICNTLLAFVYRTIFLYVLTVEYLGINGLFSNIIQVFSMAELGIGSVIIYRMYKPIKEGNIQETAALMNFYKRFYHLIAASVCVIGALFIPFLPYMIHDLSEVPSDVNIYVVYVLFVIQSAASYLFVYKQSLLDADQKGYLVSLLQMATTIVKYIALIITLFSTRDFTFTLAAGIIATICMNFIFSVYITSRYKEVFQCKNKLRKEDKKGIFKDTLALMCHKVGQTVIFTSDNIILSAFVGVKAVGIYSNYSLIILAINYILNAVLGSFTSSIGNYILSAKKEETFQLYQRLQFLNMWMTAFCAVSLYTLLNPFITIWKSEELLFHETVVFILCVDFFIRTSRIINGSFINADGLFVKDKIRPIIEATVNIIVSILLVKLIGIEGVFIGTIVSVLVTAWWREPYLLKKYVFHHKLSLYYLNYFKWVLEALAAIFITNFIFKSIPMNFLGLVLRFVICSISVNAVFLLFNFKNENFKYFLHLAKKFIKKEHL